jgi:hypothetical protein
MRSRYIGVRRVLEHEAYHAGTGHARQFDDLVPGCQENHGDQPQELHHGEASLAAMSGGMFEGTDMPRP